MAQNLSFDPENAAASAALRLICDRRAEAMAQGRTPMGWKVAITHPPTQTKLGLDGPLLGALMADTEITGERFKLPPAPAHLAELEIGVRLGADVPPDATLEQARAAISHLAPAFEILAVTGPLDQLTALAKTNAYHAGVRFGAWAACSDMLVDADLQPELLLGGMPSAEFPPEAKAGQPDEIVLFAARTLGALGVDLKAGDRLICGSLNSPIRVEAGANLRGALGPLGAVELLLD